MRLFLSQIVATASRLALLLGLMLPASAFFADQAVFADQSATSTREQYLEALKLADQQEWEEAASLFSDLTGDEEKAYAARSRYNLGVCQHQIALRSTYSSSESIQSAIEKLDQSIEAYKATIRIQNDHQDARVNWELAATLRQELLERLKDVDSSQTQPQRNNQSEQAPDDSADESNDQPSESSKDSNDDGGSGSSSGDPSEYIERQNQSDPMQSESSGKDQPQSESSDAPKDSPDPMSSKDEKDSKSSSKENRDRDPSGQGSNDGASADAADDQKTPNENGDGRDGTAGQTLEEPSESKDDADSSSEPGERGSFRQGDTTSREEPDDSEQDETLTNPESDTESKDQDTDGKLTAAGAEMPEQPIMPDADLSGRIRLTPEEAQKLLQSIRDREFFRQLRQEAARRRERVKVRKDW